MNVTDVEKTTVDCTDHLELCGGIREHVQAIVVAEDRDYSWATVVECLQRPDNGAAAKRIIYRRPARLRSPARETFLRSFMSECPLLDPIRSEQGSYDSEYHLRINVDWERLDSMES
ncbi:hypothetical protein PM025_17195 [Halorubrum ezzemoulense]|uniref:hypothetical protein n=1 Tax=Halorubrum ezzemoulense TaxID=337243 RepID=UPI00232F77CF|nr:hypothetical protein [Halorubrum ezzemoulense]MDB2265815.1 hypothetical protein [Halorubrum ezzemoulense]